MKKNQKAKKTKKEKKPLLETRVKPDNSVEVELKKNPAETIFGKILLLLIIAGMILVPLILVIKLLIDAMN
ncbi:MAG: hypothetical protein ACOX4W_01020 [Bacilli bacterium]